MHPALIRDLEDLSDATLLDLLMHRHHFRVTRADEARGDSFRRHLGQASHWRQHIDTARHPAGVPAGIRAHYDYHQANAIGWASR